MAEIRIGHDQVVLPVTHIRFNRGGMIVTAAGPIIEDRAKKITGDQPFVLVCDDGSIWAAWKADCTEAFAELRTERMRQVPHVTYVQTFDRATVTPHD